MSRQVDERALTLGGQSRTAPRVQSASAHLHGRPSDVFAGVKKSYGLPYWIMQTSKRRPGASEARFLRQFGESHLDRPDTGPAGKLIRVQPRVAPVEDDGGLTPVTRPRRILPV